MQILANATRDVEILTPLTVKGSSSTFQNGVAVGTEMPTSAIALSVAGAGIFQGNVLMSGNLTVNGFIVAKPYASLRVSTAGGTPSTGTTAVTIGTPGTVSLIQYGFLTNVSVARGTAATTNLFLYSFTLPTAHPLGTNYIVNGGFRTVGSIDPSPNAFLSFTVTSATQFAVWVRSSTSIIMDGNFHVHAVP